LDTNHYETSFPCFSDEPLHPEDEDATIDFELILKELEEQEKEK